MPICAIGEIKRHPDGKWYRKEKADKDCGGDACAYLGVEGCVCGDARRHMALPSIESGGNECFGSIWVGPVDPPAAPEPAACPIQITEEEWAQAWHRIGPGRLAEVTEINRLIRERWQALK